MQAATPAPATQRPRLAATRAARTALAVASAIPGTGDARAHRGGHGRRAG